MKRILGSFAMFLLAASTSACSALTQPEEITISAEPLPSPNAAPAPMPQGAARPAMQLPAAAGGAQKGG